MILSVAGVVAFYGVSSASAQTPEPTAYPGGRWEPGPAVYGFEVVEGERVVTDDGVSLEAIIAWPVDLETGERAAGPFPVVIEHMPYTRLGAPVTVNTFFAEHGYISALVRARGLGASEGEVQFASSREGQDGANIVDWAAHDLEGSDGRVAIIGCSWPGMIASNDAAYVGPDSPLKAVVAACSGFDNMPRQSWMNAGMTTMSFWQFDGRGAGLTGDTEAGRRFFEMMTREVMAGNDVGYAGAFWSDRSRAELAGPIVENGVPVLLYAGWGDVVETGTVRAYHALQNASAGRPVFAPMTVDQPVSPRYQMIMGGWDHAEGLDVGIYLQWIETWLNGVDTGMQETATPMHVYESGTGRWLNLTGFPQVAEYTPWNLGPDGALDTAVQGQASATLVYTQPDAEGGMVSFTTAPIADGMTLSGPISATIHASSSNTNLVMIARLYDVAPDGEAVLVSRGAVLGSQRELDADKSWQDDNGTVTWPWPRLERDDYLTPGEVYRLDISLAPRQWGIRPGHRLRFELTSQTPLAICPEEGLPASNDTDPCRLTGPQQETVPGGVYTVLLGGNTPSTLNLPQLRAMVFPEVPAITTPTQWSETYRRMRDPATDELFTLPMVWGGDQ